jgi:hypothetical protein
MVVNLPGRDVFPIPTPKRSRRNVARMGSNPGLVLVAGKNDRAISADAELSMRIRLLMERSTEKLLMGAEAS